MRQTRILMDMPITLEVTDDSATEVVFEKIFDYFHYVDETFSVFKETSEISQINRGEIEWDDYSADMKVIFQLAEETKHQTKGYFDIRTPKKSYDPSGIVKGWAIFQGSKILDEEGCEDYYLEIAGDIQLARKDVSKEPWNIGIRNPFNVHEIVKVLCLRNEGIATSGTSIRGQHIYNPHQTGETFHEVVSLTVIGPNIYEADRFATAAFAMGPEGIHFIERLNGLEGYSIDKNGLATMTSGFQKYIKP